MNIPSLISGYWLPQTDSNAWWSFVPPSEPERLSEWKILDCWCRCRWLTELHQTIGEQYLCVFEWVCIVCKQQSIVREASKADLIWFYRFPNDRARARCRWRLRLWWLFTFLQRRRHRRSLLLFVSFVYGWPIFERKKRRKRRKK